MQAKKIIHSNSWPLQDGKARFSELIRACTRKPQFITVRGVEEAVVLSKKDYENLLGEKTDFITFINQSPLKGLEFDLKRDKSPDRDIKL